MKFDYFTITFCLRIEKFIDIASCFKIAKRQKKIRYEHLILCFVQEIRNTRIGR
jgi:hypothetical protein